MFSVIGALFRSDRRFQFGAIVIVVIALVIASGIAFPHNVRLQFVVPKNLPPSVHHILGTNSVGQDIYWRLAIALRNSLLLGIVSATLGRVIAVILGLISGYLGGAVDRVLSAVMDSFIVIPRLPLLILLSFVFRQQLSVLAIGLMLGSLDWAWPGKRYRSQVLSLREMEFTSTAHFSGMNMSKIVTREHLPFLIPYVMADFISGILWAIGMEITLAVLGLSDLGAATIGTMVYWAGYYQAMLNEIWWWILPPVVAAVITILALFMLSTSISQYLDPRTRIQLIRVRGE